MSQNIENKFKISVTHIIVCDIQIVCGDEIPCSFFTHLQQSESCFEQDITHKGRSSCHYSQKINALYQDKKLEKITRCMQIVNSIENNAADLQSQAAEEQLATLYSYALLKNMTISYNYPSRGFEMAHNGPFNGKIDELGWHVRSCWVQKLDHPALRQSLYFSELKHIDEIVNIQYPKNSPKFIKDIYRKNVQNQLLDVKNPLGVPIDAPALRMLVKPGSNFELELYCRLGNINIRTIRMYKQQQGKKTYSYFIDGMNIPRVVQQTVFQFCQEVLQLNQIDYYRLHRLAYIGGRVQQLQMLMDLFETLSAGLLQE